MKYYVILDNNNGAIQWIGSAWSEREAIEKLAHEVGENPENMKEWTTIFEISEEDKNRLEDLLDRYPPDIAARAVEWDGRINPANVEGDMA